MGKRVFIAGPYIGDGSYEVIDKNIGEAEQVAIELANRDIFFFCPHTHTRHFEAKAGAEEQFYKAMDMSYLDDCDCAVATPRWRESSGARNEVKRCVNQNKQVFYLRSLDDVVTYDAIEFFAKGTVS